MKDADEQRPHYEASEGWRTWRVITDQIPSCEPPEFFQFRYPILLIVITLRSAGGFESFPEKRGIVLKSKDFATLVVTYCTPNKHLPRILMFYTD